MFFQPVYSSSCSAGFVVGKQIVERQRALITLNCSLYIIVCRSTCNIALLVGRLDLSELRVTDRFMSILSKQHYCGSQHSYVFKFRVQNPSEDESPLIQFAWEGGSQQPQVELTPCGFSDQTEWRGLSRRKDATAESFFLQQYWISQTAVVLGHTPLVCSGCALQAH